MSKNQSNSVGPRSVCIPESLPSHQTLKTVVFAYFFLLFTIHSKSSTLLSLVGVAGFEPATLRLSSACSNQLSYTPLLSGLIVEVSNPTMNSFGGGKGIRTPDL